jgi:hypothetical protein
LRLASKVAQAFSLIHCLPFLKRQLDPYTASSEELVIVIIEQVTRISHSPECPIEAFVTIRGKF